ncbi:hypothetical protein FHR81_005428 [Actinoalloteichus hoggarensis]|uniref:TadE family type IV pilus minor pilin n=1 Tax=Actinoalloteichus hoggarensis TaxID=1470176 RepID=UPI00161E2C35|nr:TadE family type IV pilus minor pilin [Actinoalloteichus hoggarensis]MBB5924351.1 hypothetical protein [Actinoalloteichus hoggarensis]
MTIEAAFGICALLVMLTGGIGGLSAVSAQVRCLDAATAAARLLARGADDAAAEAVHRIAPVGAAWDVAIHGDEIEVTVRAAVVPLIPDVRLRATVWAFAEPGARTDSSGSEGPPGSNATEENESTEENEGTGSMVGSGSDTEFETKGEAGKAADHE